MQLAWTPLARETPRVPAISTQAALRVYFFTVFAAVGLYLPFFPTWLRERGFVGAEMGILMATLPACQLLSPTFVGLLADKFALRGRMMTLCASSTAFGLSLFGAAALFLDIIPFWVAMSCMFAFAILRAPTVGLADVLAMEIAPDYGRMRLWGSLGFMVAALLGAQIIDPAHPYQLPMVIAGVIWTLAGVSLLLPRSSSLPPRPAFSDAKALLRQTTYRRLLFTVTLIFGGMTAYDMCATLRLRELGATGMQIGLFWSIATAAEVVLLIWGAKWAADVGPGKLLTLTLFVSAGRWVYLSQATNLTLMLALQPLHGVSFGLMWVSAIGVLKREVGDKGTATAQGLYAFAVATGGTLGLITWAPYYDNFGSEQLFLTAACVSGAAALSASRLIRLTRPQAQTA